MNQQRRAKIEIALVIFAFWVPSMVNALEDYSRGMYVDSSSRSLLTVVYALTARFGKIFILLFLMWSAGRRFSAFRLVRPRAMDILAGLGIFALMLITGFSYYWGEHYFHLTGLLTRSIPNPGWVGVPLLTMTGSVLYEELLYRSFLQTRLKYLGWPAVNIIVFTSVLFAATHIYQGSIRLPIVFLHGLILGASIRRYKSIWPGLIAHWMFDVILILFPYFYRSILNHIS